MGGIILVLLFFGVHFFVLTKKRTKENSASVFSLLRLLYVGSQKNSHCMLRQLLLLLPPYSFTTFYAARPEAEGTPASGVLWRWGFGIIPLLKSIPIKVNIPE